MIRAFSLLSGGLDSILATRLVMAQAIEVIGLHFATPFFGHVGQEGRNSWSGAKGFTGFRVG